ELMLTQANRVDLALPYFEAGWSRRAGDPVFANVAPCALRLLQLYAEEETPQKLLALVVEAEEFFDPWGREIEASQFYNQLAWIADRDHLAPIRDELRDRALLGIAVKLRQRAAIETRPGTVVSNLLGRSGAWAAAVVTDAQMAWNQELKRSKDE